MAIEQTGVGNLEHSITLINKNRVTTHTITKQIDMTSNTQINLMTLDNVDNLSTSTDTQQYFEVHDLTCNEDGNKTME